MKRLLRVAVGDPPRLTAVLAARLRISPEEARRLVERGAVEVDGRRVAADRELAVGARVVAFLGGGATKARPIGLAYEDEHVLVVDKPAGLRSQAVRGEAEDTLIARVQREIDPAASLLHRLDRETSGLVLLPRTNEARRRLQAALDGGQIERRYLARVAGRLDRATTVRLRIGVDGKDARRRVPHPEASSAGDPAPTHIEPLRIGEDETLVRLTLETGRTHQLRVHLSAIGHPVVGDRLYGGPPSERLWLHADELVFPDARTGAARSVHAGLPGLA